MTGLLNRNLSGNVILPLYDSDRVPWPLYVLTVISFFFFIDFLGEVLSSQFEKPHKTMGCTSIVVRVRMPIAFHKGMRLHPVAGSV